MYKDADKNVVLSNVDYGQVLALVVSNTISVNKSDLERLVAAYEELISGGVDSSE